MSNDNYIEMVYDNIEGIISFIYKGITVEYKRFNGGKMVENKGLQQLFFEYLYDHQGQLIMFHEFIDKKAKDFPFLTKSKDADTRNILHNLFDFKLNPWIRLFFPIRQEYKYKFKSRVMLEELAEKEFHNIIIKRPTRKR